MEIIPENEDGCRSEPLVSQVVTSSQESDASDKNEEEEFLYSVNAIPPIGATIMFGLQHYLLAVAVSVTLPMVIMETICVDSSQVGNMAKANILGVSFVVIGVSTFLQVTIGVRLPVLQGIAMAYFVPVITMMSGKKWKCPSRIHNASSLSMNLTAPNESYYYQDNDGSVVDSTELWQRRMREIQGGVILVSFLQFVIGMSGMLRFVIRFIGPLTIAPSLTLISFSFLGIGVKYSNMHWGIAFCAIIIILVCQYLAKVPVPFPKCNLKKKSCGVTKIPIFTMIPFLLAVCISWILCYILTASDVFPTDEDQSGYFARTDTKALVINNSPWFRIPYPFQWGWPTISIPTFIILLTSLFLGIMDSICDYYVYAQAVGECAVPQHAVNRGIVVESFCILLAGMLGSGNATTSFGLSAAAIRVIKVASRRPMQAAAIFFFVFGIFGKFCAVCATIPLPIVGGVTCGIGGMIFSLAISNLVYVDMTNSRNMFVFGFSTFMGMVMQTWVKSNGDSIDVGNSEVNDTLRSIMGSGLLIACVLGCLLDNTMPGTRASRGIEQFQEYKIGTGEKYEESPTYLLPYGNNWKWTKWIPIFPNFRKKEHN